MLLKCEERCFLATKYSMIMMSLFNSYSRSQSSSAHALHFEKLVTETDNVVTT
jgi:hypothetical protein